MKQAIVFWLLAACLGILVKTQKPTYTLVTSVSNLKQDLKTSKESVLGSAQNMIIFGPEHLKASVMEKRHENKTVYISKGFDQISKHWSYTYLKRLQTDSEQALFEDKKHFEFRRVLISIFKALKFDKFQSEFIAWTDPQELRLHVSTPETILRQLYQLVQPRWLFFTEYSQSQTDLASIEGQQKYMGRRMKKYEIVLPYMMGGSVQIIRDIKNSYETLLRILFEDKQSKFQRNSLSLMAIRFPGLIPFTMNINFEDFSNRIYKYSDVYRLPKQKRIFYGIFQKNGQILIKDDQLLASLLKSNHTDEIETNGSKVQETRPISKRMKALGVSLSDLVSRKQFYKTAANSLDILVLISLIGVQLMLISKNKSLKKAIQQKGPKSKPIQRFSEVPIETGRMENDFEVQK